MAKLALASTHVRSLGSRVCSLAGLIGFYFGARVTLTYLFFRADPQVGTLVEIALNLLLLLPTAFYAIGPSHRSFKDLVRPLPVRLVLSFLFFALVSLSWSATQSHIAAVSYWVALAADVALVLLLSRVLPADVAAPSIMKGFICGVSFLAIIAWSAPAMSDLRLGDDDYLNPNAIGFECAFAVFFCQYAAKNSVIWRWIGLALFITLIRSLSKTSMIAFLIAEGIYLIRANTVTRAAKLRLAAGAALVVGIFWSLFASYYSVYTNAGNQAETLTGRTAIWAVALGFAWEQPWFGHGLHSFRAVMPAFDLFEPWHAHNEWLQQFFAYGLAGVAIVAGLYSSFFRQLRRVQSTPLSNMCMSLLIMVLIRGLADTERFDLSFPLWALTAFSLLLVDEPSLAKDRP